MLQNEVADSHFDYIRYVPRQTQRPKSRKMKPTFKAMLLWHVLLVCYHFSHSVCAAEPASADDLLVDLTYDFSGETHSFSKKPLIMTVTSNGTSDSGDYWYQVEDISLPTHLGTHLDAPCHFYRGKWCTSDIPVSHLIAPVAMVDISDFVKNDPYACLTAEHLQDWEEKHGQIPDNSVLMVRTGWSKFWMSRRDYAGTDTADRRDMKFPFIHPDAAKWLVDNRHIVGIGIDSFSVDKPGDHKSHVTLGEKNIYNLENLNENLKMVPPTGATVFAMPMKLKDASGAPCRVVVSMKTSGSDGCRVYASTVLIGIALLVSVYLFSSKEY